MDNRLANRLEMIGKKMEKKEQQREKHGVDKFIVEAEDDDDDSCNDSDDSFEAAQTGSSIMMDNTKIYEDPSQLIDMELIQLLSYCKGLNEHKNNEDYQEEIMMKSLELGKQTAPKLLIFDMDETLIAAKFENRVPQGFVETFSYPFKGTTIRVRVRPYLSDVLEKLASLYEIVVFTAGIKDYADPILDWLDPDRKYFKKRLYRTDCIQVDQFFVKDLDIILDREQEEMVIVDNSIVSFAFNLDNGVPINSFVGTEPDDKELLFLYSFLEELASVPDVKKPIADAFRLSYLQSTIAASSTQ